jgi:hypothetical protein
MLPLGIDPLRMSEMIGRRRVCSLLKLYNQNQSELGFNLELWIAVQSDCVCSQYSW